MNCPRCGTNNRAEAGFCEECGMTLSVPQTEVLGEPVYQRDMQPLQFPPPASNGQVPYNANYPAPNQYPVYNPYGLNQFSPYIKPHNVWAAIVGLVVGIISMPLCVSGLGITAQISDEAVAVSFALNLLLACAGIAFSIIGMKGTKRGMAIAGLICNVVSAVAALIFFIIALGVLWYY